MRLIPSDPDVQTIISRVKAKDIDLQPDFQRGEVWSKAKQRKLIDSILRDWHVPPIHLVQHPDTKKQEVLDGQQRLVAIRDFVNGAFTVDGHAEPFDDRIATLDGLRYGELPSEWRRQFDQFTIRFFRIVDFHPDEPAELFFRLNQPVMLTSAEQRNAFFGPLRTQIKQLVAPLEPLHFGFTNSRMAFEDVLARVCLSIEHRTILRKVTAGQLAERYRSRVPLSNDSYGLCIKAVDHFHQSAAFWGAPLKLNKATLFSWLWLSACAGTHFDQSTAEILGITITKVESLLRNLEQQPTASFKTCYDLELPAKCFGGLLGMYLDRSSSRVSDVTSVVARDLFLWTCVGNTLIDLSCELQAPYLQTLRSSLNNYLLDSRHLQDLINHLIETAQWGQLI